MRRILLILFGGLPIAVIVCLYFTHVPERVVKTESNTAMDRGIEARYGPISLVEKTRSTFHVAAGSGYAWQLNSDNTMPWMPIAQADNPLIFRQHKLTITNASPSPRRLNYWSGDSIVITDKNAYRPARALDFAIRNAFVIDDKRYRLDGQPTLPFEGQGLRCFVNIDANIPWIIRDNITTEMAPGKMIEFPSDPFGDISWISRTTPGLFVCETTVSYVDPADGKVIKLVLEPLKVEVTEAHVRGYNFAESMRKSRPRD